MTVRNIGVLGCSGRMGRALLTAIDEMPDSQVAGAVDIAESGWVGRDLGELLGRDPSGIVIGEDPNEVFASADAVADFTTPQAVLTHAELAAASGTAWVLGTTGTCAKGDAAVAHAAKRAPVVRAANMSLGINLLAGLVRKAARVLGPEFDAEILEFHHKHKIDAPSGTALALGNAIAETRDQLHEQIKIFERCSVSGRREPGGIGYAVLRGGNIVGEHTVIFANEDERIELSHRAGSRGIFARGALRAAHWAYQKPPGLYGMDDVLGIRD